MQAGHILHREMMALSITERTACSLVDTRSYASLMPYACMLELCMRATRLGQEDTPGSQTRHSNLFIIIAALKLFQVKNQELCVIRFSFKNVRYASLLYGMK